MGQSRMNSKVLKEVFITDRRERNRMINRKRGKLNIWSTLKAKIAPEKRNFVYTHELGSTEIFDYLKLRLKDLKAIYPNVIAIPNDFYDFDKKIGRTQYVPALQDIYIDYLEKFSNTVLDCNGIRVSFCNPVEAVESSLKLKSYTSINTETLVYKTLLHRIADTNTSNYEERLYLAIIQMHGWVEKSSMFVGIAILESLVNDMSPTVLIEKNKMILGAIVYEIYQVYMYFVEDCFYDAEILDLLRISAQLNFPGALKEGVHVFRKYLKKYPMLFLDQFIQKSDEFENSIYRGKGDKEGKTAILKTALQKYV
eukprot:NODE_85_length_22318_cov_0.288492.p5 type:complete len:311 gc:universal NODE_85_length_22318_cov_0.288492:5090-6022(+)